jgi:tetratricopeptide (TPR) repeat protein
MGTGRLQSAKERFAAVVRRAPTHFHAHHNLGAACLALGHWNEAAQAYRKALEIDPRAGQTRIDLGRCLTILGRVDEAIAGYRALIADPAWRLRALTLIALLEPASISAGEADQIGAACDDPAVPRDARASLLFAHAGVLESAGRHDEAFAAFAAANAAKRESLLASDRPPPTVALEHALAVDLVTSRFTAEFIARRAGGGIASIAPIFIVGMPRSGSTLIEQILASHAGVQGMGEGPALSSLLEAGAVPQTSAGFAPLAKAYLEAMRVQGWNGRSRLVDKTLESFLHVGMIALMFPRAVILETVREPIDTCLACYRQLFAASAETLYDLAEIGAEYRRYAQVMAHWRAVLPGRVTEVRLETLVDAPESSIRWLVTQACGLSWDPACLRFFESQRPVRTASAAQVRKPISAESVGRWRRYERHLGPLIEALAAA